MSQRSETKKRFTYNSNEISLILCFFSAPLPSATLEDDPEHGRCKREREGKEEGGNNYRIRNPFFSVQDLLVKTRLLLSLTHHTHAHTHTHRGFVCGWVEKGATEPVGSLPVFALPPTHPSLGGEKV